MKKLKVCFFVNVFPKLSETFILEQIVGVLKEGFEVSIFALSLGGEEKVHGYVSQYQLYSIVRPLQDVISSGVTYDFDIIHSHFGTSAMAAFSLRNRGLIQGKLLCSFHGFDVNVKTYDRTYYRPLAFYGDHFTVNTNYTKDRALALGFPEKKISILHAGVDAAHFHPKSKLERTNGVFNILCVGRLVEKKGLIYAIAAMKLLDGFSCRDFRLDIVGDGPLNELLQVEIRRNGLSRFITMHGASTRDEVLDFMKVADVFLLPSVAAGNGDSEGQGLVLQEAQAMEIPVIASSHNGFPEGLRDGVTGFLVPEKNPLAIAERLLYLMENETVRRQMGRQGRLFVERKFEINILNKQLIQLYLKMLEE